MQRIPSQSQQHGFLMLEALIAILLFSVGILAVVAMQGTSIATVTQSKVRSDASFLADQVIGQIWANRANAATYAYAGSGTPPAAIANWVQQVQASLPNATTFPPTITVTPTAVVGPPAYTAFQVTVTLRWLMPSEFSATTRPPAHNVSFSTLIPCC
jgi:type IV pilus assembly protein PilV